MLSEYDIPDFSLMVLFMLREKHKGKREKSKKTGTMCILPGQERK
jgi:hypothetical protein